MMQWLVGYFKEMSVMDVAPREGSNMTLQKNLLGFECMGSTSGPSC